MHRENIRVDIEARQQIIPCRNHFVNLEEIHKPDPLKIKRMQIAKNPTTAITAIACSQIGILLPNNLVTIGISLFSAFAAATICPEPIEGGVGELQSYIQSQILQIYKEPPMWYGGSILSRINMHFTSC